MSFNKIAATPGSLSVGDLVTAHCESPFREDHDGVGIVTKAFRYNCKVYWITGSFSSMTLTEQVVHLKKLN